MREEPVSARLLNIGRDLQSRLKEFFEHPLDSKAAPLELLQTALEDLERRVQPAGRGRKMFPYDRVVVHITQHGADEAAIHAVFRDFGTRLGDRLAELHCEAPAAIDTSVVLNDTAGEGTPTTVRIECVGAVDAPAAPAAAVTRPAGMARDRVTAAGVAKI